MNKLMICAMIFTLFLAGCSSSNNNEKYIADEDNDISDELLLSNE